jgi:hypothetical protein
MLIVSASGYVIDFETEFCVGRGLVTVNEYSQLYQFQPSHNSLHPRPTLMARKIKPNLGFLIKVTKCISSYLLKRLAKQL